MQYITLLYEDGKEFSYAVHHISEDKIQQLKSAPGVREVKVRGSIR